MPTPIVHFEIIGRDPSALRAYYGELFGWAADTDSPVAPEVSEEGNYGFIDPVDGGIAGGIGGGSDFPAQVVIYAGVENVEQALQRAEALGGTRVMGPAKRPDGDAVVAHFTDPEGNLIGLAGPR